MLALAITYTNASHRNLLDESHTCNLLSFLQLPSAGSNNPAHVSPNDGAFASPSCHRPLFWGVVLRHVLGQLHLWLWLVLRLDGLWLWICDLWLWYLTCGSICCYLSCGCDIMCENGFVVIYMWLLWCLWYIYMTCDIYLNCLCQWNAKNKKKICSFGWFAECNGHDTRQS